MQLDDLRRTWQHSLSPAIEPPIDERALTDIISRQSDGPVDRLRRNARIEVVLNLCVILGSLALIGFSPKPIWRLLGLQLVFISLICLYYLYRKLRLLQGMTEHEGDLRGHLIRITTGIRSLVHFYYNFSLALTPVALLSGFLMGVFYREVPRSPFSSTKFALGLGGLIVTGAAFYWVISRFTRWYLQRLYGQHLDRLESLLRELEE